MNNFPRFIARLALCVAFAVCGILSATAQNSEQIKLQKAKIARLEKQIAQEEATISRLRKDKSSAEECIRRTAQQIRNRSKLIEETEKELDLINDDIRQADRSARKLDAKLAKSREEYAEMVREAYRNYKHNSVLNYLFASESFMQVARKLTILRKTAELRKVKMDEIVAQNQEVARQREILAERKASLDKVSAKLTRERKKLQEETDAARRSMNQLSAKERKALSRKNSREQQLDSAIAEMRRLTKGNKEGDSFTRNTSGLKLPVQGGVVKQYMGNMAEIAGRKGAAVITIYTGKVVEVRQNRLNGHYDVYVAHGEYISTYANLSSVCVERGQKVQKNQKIGVIGSSLDIATMNMDYRIIFGIYPPDAKTKMNAKDCFR